MHFAESKKKKKTTTRAHLSHSATSVAARASPSPAATAPCPTIISSSSHRRTSGRPARPSWRCGTAPRRRAWPWPCSATRPRGSAPTRPCATRRGARGPAAPRRATSPRRRAWPSAWRRWPALPSIPSASTWVRLMCFFFFCLWTMICRGSGFCLRSGKVALWIGTTFVVLGR